MKSLKMLALTTALTPIITLASGGDGGFSDGFTHPFLGLDHAVAMVAVGILSASHKKTEIWLYPTVFVGALVIGALLGMQAIELPLVEYAISLSVFLLGLSTLFIDYVPSKINTVFIFIFGLFHGHAHGSEIPDLAQPLIYIAGFSLASALLHLLGVFFGMANQKLGGHTHYRLKFMASAFIALSLAFMISIYSGE